tara:strand:- start:97 stop:1104 length:1008 start_codon:yes stop_codon:yes gene_type:complete
MFHINITLQIKLEKYLLILSKLKMENIKNNFKIASFYRFVKLSNKKKIKVKLDNYLKNKLVKGTILLSDEGINGFLSSEEQNVLKALKYLKKLLRIRKISLKIHDVDFIPFNRMKVRLKKEIVSLGVEEIKINELSNNYIQPSEWNNFINKKNVRVLDVRNIYEIDIGKFKNAINPQTNSFRDLPKSLKQLNLKKNDTIAMYCTGGIRCEKASFFLKSRGYTNIFQLSGGILNYFNHHKNNIKQNKWSGDCFVFDNRVTVNKKLETGKFKQCYGCRRPISIQDTKSKKYIKGVCCPYCFNLRTKEQKRNSLNRQKQIVLAENKGIDHPFKRIKEL